ncbi:MAG: undecaprenyl-diphosphate phosphatase, partial [Clostridia bacterium]|nr:undecaprenyl-diphosphate phosphatase [Clostridia bacterium]
MSVFVAIFLGIVQGLTEFLPVSSSGHLVLFQKIFGIDVDCLFFDIVVHLGTLFAVCVVFKKTILEMIKHPFCEKSKKIVFATIPTVLIAVCFKDFFKSAFNGNYLFVGFLTTAIFMFIATYVSKHNYQYKSMTFASAGVMGVFQGLAIMPGVSRSGSTITSALVQGVRRNESAEFSFLMSIPAILGSLVFELFDLGGETINISFFAMFFCFFFSSVSGYLAIKLMLKIIKKAKFFWFGIYLFLL